MIVTDMPSEAELSRDDYLWGISGQAPPSDILADGMMEHTAAAMSMPFADYHWQDGSPSVDQAGRCINIGGTFHFVSPPSVPGRWSHLGTEADRARARSGLVLASPHTSVPLAVDSGDTSCAAGTTAPQGDLAPLVGTLTPSQAADRRRALLEERKARFVEYRESTHRQRRVHERAGLRPPRTTRRRFRLCTANVNAAATLTTELTHGSTLPSAHLIAIQEHRCLGENCDRAMRDWARLGWSGSITQAYVKNHGAGGGTGVLGRHQYSAIPYPLSAEAQRVLLGRCTATYVNVLGGILIVSFYGKSGVNIAGQLDLLAALGTFLRTCGLPYIVAGDWQVAPEALQEAKFPHRVGGQIFAPPEATNLKSGNVIDYFLVSHSIAAAVDQVETRPELYLSPHIPVFLQLSEKAVTAAAYCPAQPKVLPAGAPRGPQLPAASVDWSAHDFTQHDVDTSLDHWYAGAEFELLGLFGFQGEDDEVTYMGVGLPLRMVRQRSAGRFRGSPDQLGLVGHRLAWTAKQASAVAFLGERMAHRAALGPRMCPPLACLVNADRRDSHFLGDQRSAASARALIAIAKRAAAFAVELKHLPGNDEVLPFLPHLRSALDDLASLARPRKGNPPLVSCWAIGFRPGGGPETFRERAASLTRCLARAVAAKRRSAAAAMRQWVRAATLKQAHAGTKPVTFTSTFSASPSKAHAGEGSPQAAADRGCLEWNEIWHGTDVPETGLLHKLMQAVPRDGDPYSRFFVPADGPYVPLDLPEITGERLQRTFLTFRSCTAAGTDWVRLRHLALLSPPALDSLATLLGRFEQHGIWPAAIASTVAVALGKKLGGARLIGVATSLYRAWARLRYNDVRDELEMRLSRPFLAAAPQQGAVKAVTDLALRAEMAQLDGLESAATLIDISKYFDTIDLTDVAIAADIFGVPRSVISLCLDFYLAPRRIRVGKAWSAASYPRRSIVPGCTWAMVFIRCIMVGPTERFILELCSLISGNELALVLRIYVDDLTLLVSGPLRGLTSYVAVAAHKLIDWVQRALRLTVAVDKLICIASSAQVRNALKEILSPAGFRILFVATCLGADFTAGGCFRSRLAFAGRLRAAGRRKGKLRWWRARGGAASAVARSGIAASALHAVEVSGIPPAPMLAVRRAVVAAAPVGAKGASLTARLALGGEGFADIDPKVLFHNMPLKYLLAKLWRHPEDRPGFVRAWNLLRSRFASRSLKWMWAQVRGPLSAAWVHLREIGARWESPFLVVSRGLSIDLLVTAPYRTYQILAVHARIVTDTRLLERTSLESGWDWGSISAVYTRGIDWDEIRKVIRRPHDALSGAQRRGLLLAATDAFWEEERRWLAGYVGSATCFVCHAAFGDKQHKYEDCPGVAACLDWAVVGGRAAAAFGQISAPGLAPFRWMAWPPAAHEPAFIDAVLGDGELVAGFSGGFYGDGSCFAPAAKAGQSAAWSLVLPGAECVGSRPSIANVSKQQWSAGLVSGFFPSSFRGELLAIIQFYRVAGFGSTYVGDCKPVIDGAANGVPPHLLRPEAHDVDLWSVLARLRRARSADHLTVRWVKSHMTYAKARAQGAQAIRDWHGNAMADLLAKQKALSHFSPRVLTRLELHSKIATAHLGRIATAVEFNLAFSPKMRPLRARTRTTLAGRRSMNGHVPIPVGIGGWRCRICRCRASTTVAFRSLFALPCKGHFLRRIHCTHRLAVSSGVVWCELCGAYSVEKMVRLASPCPKRAGSAIRLQRLRLLRRGGIPPASAAAVDRLWSAPFEDLVEDAVLVEARRVSQAAQAITTSEPVHLASALRPRLSPKLLSSRPGGQVVGVYLRLQPAVASARFQAMAQMVGRTAVVAVAPPQPGRRFSESRVRVSVKGRRAHVRICLAADSLHWTRRASLACARRCDICGGASRFACNWCGSRVCFNCLRNCKACPRQLF